ncbi:MAG: glycosyltransferase [Myxococcota bacterium]
MDYLIAVEAVCRPLGAGRFAVESAFLEHLRLLRDKLGSRFSRMVLVAPVDGHSAGAPLAGHLAEVDEAEEGISLLPLHVAGRPPMRFWRDAVSFWPRVRQAVREAAVVHGALSSDLYRPAMALVNLAVVLEDTPALFVVDIDHRRDAWMLWKSGLWSLRSFLVTRLLHDPFRHAQVKLAARRGDLVLIKSPHMVADVGRGAPNVRDFYDPVHASEHVLDAERMAARARWLRRAEGPLELLYFGRLVPYKGVDRTLRALHQARAKAGEVVRLHILGEGEERARLEGLVRRWGLEDAVTFEPSVPYGAPLFERMDRADAMVATPLSEDTPRAAFDAMARGLPILAFGNRYYQDLERDSGAVRTVPWPNVEALADAIVRLQRDREPLADMAEKGVAFARRHTQDAWLDRRIAWTLELLDGAQPRSRRASAFENNTAAKGMSSTR